MKRIKDIYWHSKQIEPTSFNTSIEPTENPEEYILLVPERLWNVMRDMNLHNVHSLVSGIHAFPAFFIALLGGSPSDFDTAKSELFKLLEDYVSSTLLYPATLPKSRATGAFPPQNKEEK